MIYVWPYLFKVLRYANFNGDTICLIIRLTADLTSLIRDHETQMLGVQHQMEQPSIEHWVTTMVTQGHESELSLVTAGF